MQKTVRTLRNTTHLASLGLPENSVQRINELISSSWRLKDGFTTIERATIASADILFVNSEAQQVMDFYAKCHSKISAIPIFVHKKKTGEESQGPAFPEYPNAITLSAPISLVELSKVLLGVISSKKVDAKPLQESVEKVNSFKVLVVDDSYPVRKYLEKKLPVLMTDIDRTLDFDIQFAASGKEAVAEVKAAKGTYDMVFLDIMMEDIDGYKICKWIKKVKRSINVVMLTGKSSPFDRVRANLSGCDSYLSKPPKDVDLKKVIMKYIEEKKSINKANSQRNLGYTT